MPEDCPQTTAECSQAPSILQIGQLVQGLNQSLEAALSRMETRDIMMIDALKKVAEQGARLDAQQAQALHQGEELDNLFERVRGIEEAIGKDGSTIDLKIGAAVEKRLEKIIRFVELITSWPAMVLAGILAVLTVVGTIFDLWYHSQGVAMLWEAYKAIKK